MSNNMIIFFASALFTGIIIVNNNRKYGFEKKRLYRSIRIFGFVLIVSILALLLKSLFHDILDKS
ncbi:putative membrane protein [Pedobacter sp. UYP24]